MLVTIVPNQKKKVEKLTEKLRYCILFTPPHYSDAQTAIATLKAPKKSWTMLMLTKRACDHRNFNNK